MAVFAMSALLLILSGVCAYAAVNHVVAASRRPLDVGHLLFAGMCLAVAGYGPTEALGYRAHNIGDYIVALKWSTSFILALGILLPYFVAAATGMRATSWPAISGVLLAALLLISLFRPYTLQFEGVPTLGTRRLPWGETIASPIGQLGPGFWMAAVLIGLNYLLAVIALGQAWRRERTLVKAALTLAVGLALAGSVEGILVRAGALNFVPLGMPAVFFMVIVMSVALIQEGRQRLMNSERRFRSLVEQSPFSIQVLSADGRTVQVNRAWESLWGKKAKASALQRHRILEDPQLIEKGLMSHIERAFAGTACELPPMIYDPAADPVLRGPKRDRWVRAFVYPIKDEAGAVRDVILMHEDVTERKRVSDAIRLIAAGVAASTGERFFEKLVRSLAEMLGADYAAIDTFDRRDPERATTLVAWARGRIVEGGSYALAGTPASNVLQGSTSVYPRELARLFPQDQWLTGLDIQAYIGAPLRDADGMPVGLISVRQSRPLENVEGLKQIIEIFAARAGAELQRERAEAEVRRMAYEDYLTGLANRALLHKRLGQALSQARIAHTAGALLLIDLDHFKTINDALGHDVGDAVLQAVARKLAAVCASNELVARLGGDEFVVMLEAPLASAAESAASALAERIMQTLTAPVLVAGRAFTVIGSIGMALFDETTESQADVLRHADLALYRAKGLGRGMIQSFVPSLQENVRYRLRVEEGLRQAIANERLSLSYQPQVDAAGGLVGAEVLLRWHDPVLGNIPPSLFVPLAEESGLIHALGGWVLEKVCARLKDWQREPARFAGRLSINVSAWQFARPDFVGEVRRALAVHETDPHRLTLELTESAFLYDLEESVAKLRALRKLGFAIAMDDFGTGYSSLAYLRELPLDQIKIDKAFVAELDCAAEHSLIESMISIGKHMRLEVIAEGVETETQRSLLSQLGCERFQGYLFGHPMTERDFLQWLTAREAALVQ